MLSTPIRCFLAVVDNGSITAAAEQLNMVKSSVSLNLKNLEIQMGTTLISRTTRKQALTAAGKNFYQHCKKIAHLVDAAIEDVHTFDHQPSGPFKITAPHAVVETKISYAVAQLMHQYPRLKPSLSIDDRRLDLIEHNIDVAITVGQLKDSTYKASRIGTLTNVLCISTDFLKTHHYSDDAVNNINTVAQWPYIGHVWQGQNIKHAITTDSQASTDIMFKPTIQANTIGTVKALVLKNLGLGFLPKAYIEQELHNKQLKLVLVKQASTESPIYAVHNHAELVPKAVVYFIDALKQKLSGHAV